MWADEVKRVKAARKFVTLTLFQKLQEVIFFVIEVQKLKKVIFAKVWYHMNGKAKTDLYGLIALSNCNVDAVFNALQELLNDDNLKWE